MRFYIKICMVISWPRMQVPNAFKRKCTILNTCPICIELSWIMPLVFQKF